MAKKKAKAKVKKKVFGSPRYRSVQKILSQYTKSAGIKLGKSFNKTAGELYRKTKGSPLKYINQNIEQLYKEFSAPAVIKVEFPDDFPFYSFLDKIVSPIFDMATISIKMKDDSVDYYAKGNSEEVEEYFRDTIYKRCREAYNESPVATLKIIDTDNNKFVDYEVVTGSARSQEAEEREEEIKQELGIPKVDAPAEEKAIDKEIELMKARERILDKEIASQTAKQKTMTMVLDLLKQGFTKEEIKNMIGF